MSEDDATVEQLTAIITAQCAALDVLWRLVESDKTWTDAGEVAERVTRFVMALRLDARQAAIRESSLYLEPESARDYVPAAALAASYGADGGGTPDSEMEQG